MASDGKYHIEAPSTAITQLLASNNAPVLVQLATVQEGLREAEDVFRHLSDHITTTQLELDRALAERDKVAGFVQAYKKVLHPIRRIPADVLLEIFSYCLEYPTSFSLAASLAINSLDTGNAPWSLGQVCKHWRSVVVGAPRLWSSITLNLPKSKSKIPGLAKQRQLEAKALMLLSQRLAWTKDCLLDVVIRSPDAFHPLLSLVCSHSSRWRRAIISLPEPGLQALSSITGRLPALETLHIHRSDSNLDPLSQAIDAFQYAPKLASVTTHNISPISSQILLPWTQLESWNDGSEHRPPTIRKRNHGSLALLESCTNLADMITTCEGSAPAGQHLPTVRHVQLRSLTIRLSLGEPIEQFLHAVTLPLLKTLTVRVQSGDTPDSELSMRSVSNLIQRSQCLLTFVELEGFNLDFEDSCVRDFLTSSESLEILSISCPKNSFLRGLCLPTPDSQDSEESSKRMLLPNLDELWLTGSRPGLDQLLLVDMLESRVKHGRLTELDMFQFKLDHSEAITRFDSLVQAKSCDILYWTKFTLVSSTEL